MTIKKIMKYPLFTFFTIIIVIFTFLDIVKPINFFSELENRTLSQKPKFTLYNLFYSDYINNYNNYINDQFIFRDLWIDLKSITEYLLGKRENNGIIYTKDGFMFQKQQNLNLDRLNKNILAIEDFVREIQSNSTLMLIPNSYTIYEEKLPIGLELIDEKKIISSIYSYFNKLSLNTLDVVTPLINNKKDYIYYKTDHHWTSYGAYIAYYTYVKSLNLTPVDINSLVNYSIPDFYGSYFSKAKLFNSQSDAITYFENNNLEISIDGIAYKSLYDLNKFKERDKYSAFLRGNNGLTIIRNKDVNDNIKGKRVLVFKDSYANCFVNFLTYNFEEVYVIDLRSFNKKIKEFIKEKSFNEVLIMYNIVNLSEDVNIVKFKY